MKTWRRSIWMVVGVCALLLGAAALAPVWADEGAGGTVPPLDCDDIDAIPRAECEALHDFFFAMNGPHWYVKPRCSDPLACPQREVEWFASPEVCRTWVGVRCSETTPVHVIRLHDPWLWNVKGTPPASLAALTQLRMIAWNQYPPGSLSPVLLDLPNLEWLWVADACVPSTAEFTAWRTQLVESGGADPTLLRFCPTLYLPQVLKRDVAH